ncbi:anaerobic benzoate catabolism transcriptional regulator [Caulifigura coniformis]|uniref:Anaerobic benzoate catabolism transcriptional regulator n=1 Tax=Caulifigura coniformis TaxID=2527983 RepID=A0A517SDV5_9PLAN|nr:helix-turn-helix transcriptional regulator [Caulifigura coniformis]QDT54291.1 anaerobic benzoate catabolism transcriptional regulator [Caulifigura coniformis]
MARVTALQHFGTVIRERREELRLTQEELAGQTGFDRTYISLIERGRRNLSLLNICKFAVALRTTPSALLKGVPYGADSD